MLFPLYDENPTSRTPVVTIALITVNAIMLAVSTWLSVQPDQLALRKLFYTYGFVPARVTQLSTGKPLQLDLAPNVPARQIVQDRFGRIFQREIQKPMLVLEPSYAGTLFAACSAMFLHGGLLHFLGNMWFLWLFGNNIEDCLGHASFLLLYFLGGLLATVVHCLMIPPPATLQPIIGASGAVAVTLGAYAVTYPRARVHSLVLIIFYFTVVDLPALAVLGFWFFIQFFNGMDALRVQVGNPVAWWAHVGGFVVGALVMPWLYQPNDDRPSFSANLTA